MYSNGYWYELQTGSKSNSVSVNLLTNWMALHFFVRKMLSSLKLLPSEKWATGSLDEPGPYWGSKSRKRTGLKCVFSVARHRGTDSSSWDGDSIVFRNEDWTGLRFHRQSLVDGEKPRFHRTLRLRGAGAGRSYLTETSASARGVGILHSENVPS